MPISLNCLPNGELPFIKEIKQMKNKNFAPVSLAALCLVAGAMAAVPGTTNPPNSSKEFTPEQVRQMWQPVRMTAAELADEMARPDPKRDGALVLAQLAEKCKGVAATDGAGKNAPNYYMYRGFKVTMPLMPRLAVQFAAKLDAEQQVLLLQQLGLAAEKVGGIGSNLVLVDVTGGFASTDACRAMIEKLTASEWISFASPVFAAPLAEDAWWTPTRDVAVAVKPELAEAGWTAAGMVGEAAPELSYVEAIGSVAGAGRAAIAGKNGFDAMVAANRLNGDARFAHAEPSAIQRFIAHVVPNDPRFDEQWFLNNVGSQANDIDAPEAWDFNAGNSNVRIAILDEGTQEAHPDLNQLTGRDFTTGAAAGINDGDPTSSCEKHGTPVAGLVTATFNNNLGVAGVAPNCLSIACKVSDLNYAPNPCDRFYTAFSNTWAANALAWSIDQGARVSNMSYGVGGPSATFEAQVSDNYTAGMLSIASAGNNGVPGLGYPSSAPLMVSVAALNSNGTRASFSSYGTGLDISAPGVGCLTIDRTGSEGYNTAAGVAGDYTSFGGTSAASPVTAGCAALFFSNNRLATAVNARFALLFSARDLGAAGYDTDFGYGFVNANDALGYYAPSNDACGNATTIDSVVYTNTQNTRFATAITREPNEECGSATNSKSVYYRFSTFDYGTATIDTAGSSYDTVLSVFSSCGITLNLGTGPIYLQPTEYACDDDGGAGTTSLISNLAMTPGITYRIKAAEFGTSASGGGDLTLNFNFTATAPPNDTCTNATEIASDASTYNPVIYSTRLATVSSACAESDDACVGVATGHSVWYKFRPTGNGSMTVDTEGSDFDTVLSVYQATAFGCPFTLGIGGTCVAMNSIACDDDINGAANRQSSITTLLNGDTTYYIKVSEFGTGDGGLLDFNFSFTPVACSPADVNGDGVVDGSDFTAFINSFAVGDPTVDGLADLNHDGTIDGSDYTAFINAFSAGC